MYLGSELKYYGYPHQQYYNVAKYSLETNQTEEYIICSRYIMILYLSGLQPDSILTICLRTPLQAIFIILVYFVNQTGVYKHLN